MNPKSIAAEFTAGWEGMACVAACLTAEDGQLVLWAVMECTKPYGKLEGPRYRPAGHRWILCVLIDCYRGDWGYKDMDETVGPNYYSCPVEFLDMAPQPETDWARDWRLKVLANTQRV
jgi:hypothetical protein